MTSDREWMKRALRLARKGWGMTSPNPMVGAVVVKDDVIIGQGWHQRAGLPHAEVVALDNAGSDARDATLYVTLEPCSSYGRTPPCVEAILNARVKRVVIGTFDPNPKHSGASLKILKEHGVEVRHGVEMEQCQTLNEAFFCWIRHNRPYVVLKMAMTLDGKIATRSGESKWISGPVSRRKVQRLRQWCDAIMVGAETIRLDNPALLVRSPARWPRQPLRLIASFSRNLGSQPNVLDDGRAETRIIACRSRDEWTRLFQQLGAENRTALLVEGGGRLAGDLLRLRLIDKIIFFVAPKILGGHASRPVVAGFEPAGLADAIPIHDWRIRRSGADLMAIGYLTDVHRLH